MSIAAHSEPHEIAEAANALATMYIKYDGDFENGLKFHKVAHEHGHIESSLFIAEYFRDVLKDVTAMEQVYLSIMISYPDHNKGIAANELAHFYDGKDNERALLYYKIADTFGYSGAKHSILRLQHGYSPMVDDEHGYYPS
jgi:TPR repeat protein